MKRLCLSLLVLAAGCSHSKPKPHPAPASQPAPLAVHADHPAYLHALTDLRAARWALQHRPGDRDVRWDEAAAIQEIDAAIGEIKKAAIDDGKDLNDHPAQDAGVVERGARLHEALRLLQQAHADVREHEDNTYAEGLRERALKHVHQAAELTKQGILAADGHL